jgi:hypothetical protein
MSETELVKRMADTLYNENGLVASVSEIKGGVRAIVWMFATVLAMITILIAYLAYLSSSPEHHAIFISGPASSTTASSDATMPYNP